ncbi:MAG: hypothetical protein JXQ65_10265 [Candidatus Marinimicrobia bacterium]|nr:hypothetical protein [Candidatus Neomarinimicrobiota bacterium]
MLTLSTAIVVLGFSILMLGLVLSRKERRQKSQGKPASCDGCTTCSCHVQFPNHCQEK